MPLKGITKALNKSQVKRMSNLHANNNNNKNPIYKIKN